MLINSFIYSIYDEYSYDFIYSHTHMYFSFLYIHTYRCVNTIYIYTQIYFLIYIERDLYTYIEIIINIIYIYIYIYN